MQASARTKGFTLVELITSAVAMAIVVLGIGMALFHAHRSWAINYDRVHGDITTDAYAAKRTFDSVVRKSSLSEKPPKIGNDGESVELYYYRDLTSTNIDGYANFKLQGSNLIVTYGKLAVTASEKSTVLRTETLVHNIKDAKFTIDGANVRMTMTLEDQGWTMVVTCSAVRHSS